LEDIEEAPPERRALAGDEEMKDKRAISGGKRTNDSQISA
jgi:hypothetical protein